MDIYMALLLARINTAPIKFTSISCHFFPIYLEISTPNNFTCPEAHTRKQPGKKTAP